MASRSTRSVSRANASQISVTGEGKIAAKPDIATLSATIVTEKPTVSEAQAKNTESSNAVADFLNASGIDSKDMKTTN